jgi:hypothetical protein
VFVTGGGSGIGASIVEHLCAQRARVAFVDIQREPSVALVEAIRARDLPVPTFISCDLRDVEALRWAVAEVRTQRVERAQEAHEHRGVHTRPEPHRAGPADRGGGDPHRGDRLRRAVARGVDAARRRRPRLHQRRGGGRGGPRPDPLALPAALLFRAIASLNIAVARPQVVMRLQVAGLVLKVLLSYLLVFGAGGLPRLGAVGGALASVVVFWALLVAGWTHTRLDPFYRQFTIVRAWPRWSVLRELIALGVPMGLSYAIEATSFTFITLLVARLGTAVMGGHQVVANLAALCFMLPMSLSLVLTGHASADTASPAPPPRAGRAGGRARAPGRRGRPRRPARAAPPATGPARTRRRWRGGARRPPPRRA